MGLGPDLKQLKFVLGWMCLKLLKSKSYFLFYMYFHNFYVVSVANCIISVNENSYY